jgi:hypothetical protein
VLVIIGNKKKKYMSTPNIFMDSALLISRI